MTILESVLKIALFAVGFAYGLIRGNQKTHWMLRALGCGLAFAFFYIVLPAVALHEQSWQPPVKDVVLPPELGAASDD